MATITGMLTERLRTAFTSQAAADEVKTILDGAKTILQTSPSMSGRLRDASITVGAENTNVRAITIQLKDETGADMAVRTPVLAFLLLDANGDAFAATGGSTGIAIGTDGALLALVAKKVFLLISEADGDIDLTWTDTGTEAAYLALLMPNGRMVISDALTNAP